MLYFFQTQADLKVSVNEFVQCEDELPLQENQVEEFFLLNNTFIQLLLFESLEFMLPKLTLKIQSVKFLMSE